MIMRITAILAVAGAILLTVSKFSEAAPVCGSASWYALTSMTASGEQMNPAKMTAAHRSYRFGTKLRVTNKRNGRSVIVRINDRGPFTKGRILDVSKAAAGQLGFINAGHAPVCIEQIS